MKTINAMNDLAERQELILHFTYVFLVKCTLPSSLWHLSEDVPEHFYQAHIYIF